jgi:hypothetical protein
VTSHRGPPVAGELDEIEVVMNRDRAREIGDEEQTRLEGADEERLRAAVVGSDLPAEIRDAGPDLIGGQVDVADALVGMRYEASSSRYRWARRSMSRL